MKHIVIALACIVVAISARPSPNLLCGTQNQIVCSMMPSAPSVPVMPLSTNIRQTFDLAPTHLPLQSAPVAAPSQDASFLVQYQMPTPSSNQQVAPATSFSNQFNPNGLVPLNSGGSSWPVQSNNVALPYTGVSSLPVQSNIGALPFNGVSSLPVQSNNFALPYTGVSSLPVQSNNFVQPFSMPTQGHALLTPMQTGSIPTQNGGMFMNSYPQQLRPASTRTYQTY